ncbi:hypothetical protein BDV95DRAFT_562280 [Massariosphaeria phaeospora]|uniref:Secreted protein n=1 Tax=Massariosphaeria phaeospora TaxID=100035 RepID=A0A7C8IE30_9PLEO|nr:hypothetical protein BDV95DRAFT_562280 [Massariosphaeria phaeospora]
MRRCCLWLTLVLKRGAGEMVVGNWLWKREGGIVVWCHGEGIYESRQGEVDICFQSAVPLQRHGTEHLNPVQFSSIQSSSVQSNSLPFPSSTSSIPPSPIGV